MRHVLQCTMPHSKIPAFAHLDPSRVPGRSRSRSREEVSLLEVSRPVLHRQLRFLQQPHGPFGRSTELVMRTIPKSAPGGAGDHPQGWWWGHRRQPILCRSGRQQESIWQEQDMMISVSVAAFPADEPVPPPRYSVLSGPHAPTTGQARSPATA